MPLQIKLMTMTKLKKYTKLNWTTEIKKIKDQLIQNTVVHRTQEKFNYFYQTAHNFNLDKICIKKSYFSYLKYFVKNTRIKKKNIFKFIDNNKTWICKKFLVVGFNGFKFRWIQSLTTSARRSILWRRMDTVRIT